ARQRLLVATVEDALEGDEPLETGDADEEAEAVPREHLADLTVTAGLRFGSDVCQPISAHIPPPLAEEIPSPACGGGSGWGRRGYGMERWMSGCSGRPSTIGC